MANSNLFQYFIIITIASSNSASLDRFLQSNPYNKRPNIDNQFLPYNPELPLRTYPGERELRYLNENKVKCEVKIQEEILEEDGYEFFPDRYINKTCVETDKDPYVVHAHEITKPEICLHKDEINGCNTVYDYIYILKRNKMGNGICFEYEQRIVGVGCKCNIRFLY